MASFSPKSSAHLVDYSDDDDDYLTQGERLSRSSSPTLPLYHPRTTHTKSPSPPLSPDFQKSDSLQYSWTSDELEFSTPPSPKSKNTPPTNDRTNIDSLNLSPQCKMAQVVSILGTQKKRALKPPRNPQTATEVPTVPRTHFTRKRAADALREDSLRKIRLAKGKRNIGDDDEPILVDELEEDHVKVRAGAPSVSKNYEKFLRMGPQAYYASQTLLKWRTLDDEVLSNSFVKNLLKKLRFQGWAHLFTETNPVVHKEEVIDFYAHLQILDELVVNSTVKGIDIVFDVVKLGDILQIPSEGLEEYVWRTDEDCFLTAKFSQGKKTKVARKVLKGEMAPDHKLLFEIVNKEILPRTRRRHEASFRDMGFMNALDLNEKINFPALMIKHMGRVTAPKTGAHGLAYGYLLTKVFKDFGVPLGNGTAGTKKDKITLSTLEECDCVTSSGPRMNPSRPMTQSLLDLHAALKEITRLKEENAGLKESLSASQAQVDSLKTEMIAQQTKHLQNIQSLMDLIPKPTSLAFLILPLFLLDMILVLRL